MESLSSQVAFGPGKNEADITSLGEVSEPYARSTIKVVILAALLDAVGGVEGMTQTDIDSAGLAIRDSSNDAARSLYLSLAEKVGGEGEAAAAMTKMLREGGDGTTSVPVTTPAGLPPSFISNYGATLWSVEGQAEFMRGLLNLDVLDETSTDFILTLMGEITPLGGSGWGFGGSAPRVDPRYKPGWGDNPAGNFLARQMGAIALDGQDLQVSISVASVGSSQDDAYFRASETVRLTLEALEEDCN